MTAPALAADQAGRDLLAMAMGHVIMKEFYFDKRSVYFDDYARRYTDLPMLVMLREHTTVAGATIMVRGLRDGTDLD